MDRVAIITKYFPVHFIVVFTVLALISNSLIKNKKYKIAGHIVYGLVFVSVFGGIGFAGLVIAMTVFTYAVAKLIERASETRTKKLLLLAGIIIPIAFLLILKQAYVDKIMSSFGIKYAIGISYFIFKFIHVAVDTYRGLITDVSFINICALIFFYPTFTAGPIERYNHFINSAVSEAVNKDDVEEGTRRIIYGLFKKFILADKIYLAISAANIAALENRLIIVYYLYLLSLKIYFDFSGYTDIAIGLSRFFGIKVFENFDRPYSKRNIVQFWQSWHMTLTGWLRHYVFLPVAKKLVVLNKNKYPLINNAFAQIVTMSIVGLWHGITLNFFLWGLYHGIGLSLYRVIADKSRKRFSEATLKWLDESNVWKAVSIFITFNYVAIGWVFFTYDISTAMKIITKLFVI